MDIEEKINVFEQEHGRKPRVLHLSNIANNSYLNAKILNERGIHSDVISADYYHIMGCPEWEDADFTGNHNDDFYPDWHQVNLNGFKRPDWFIQGTKKSCINYLIASNRNFKYRRFYYKLILTIETRLYEHSSKNIRALAKKIRIFLFYFKVAIIKTISLFGKVFYKMKKIFSVRENKVNNNLLAKEVKTIESNDNDWFNNRIDFLDSLLKRDFPERYSHFHKDILRQYKPESELWKTLFEDYDIIHAYGIDGIYPLLAGKKYVSFEHGTLRHFPFQNDSIGFTCLLAYKYADGVLITNADNIKAAEKLKLKNFSFIPHPINEATLECDDLTLKTVEKKISDSDFVIYHPPRHHWEKERHPNWEKGNDIFIIGFARFVDEVDKEAVAVFVEWGQKLDESKELIKKLGIENNIAWIKPQHNYNMTRYIKMCDIVADQFFLGAFGDIMPKTFMHGKPALLNLNEDLHEWCFDEMPPVLNAKNSEDVFKQLKKFYEDDAFRKEISQKGKDWYHEYHSNELIYEKLMTMYCNIIDCGNTKHV